MDKSPVLSLRFHSPTDAQKNHILDDNCTASSWSNVFEALYAAEAERDTAYEAASKAVIALTAKNIESGLQSDLAKIRLAQIEAERDRYREALETIAHTPAWTPDTFNRLIANVACEALNEPDDE
jgi:predicted negative regulator of RcsB-dependent stress response